MRTSFNQEPASVTVTQPSGIFIYYLFPPCPQLAGHTILRILDKIYQTLTCMTGGWDCVLDSGLLAYPDVQRVPWEVWYWGLVPDTMPSMGLFKLASVQHQLTGSPYVGRLTALYGAGTCGGALLSRTFSLWYNGEQPKKFRIT